MNQVNYFFEDVKNCRHQLPAKSWIKQCLIKEKQDLGCINFIFCSDKYLRAINQKYLKKSYLTDVISFKNTPPKTIVSNKINAVFGDVFISVERVKENKITYKTIFAKELQRVMIHGVLHLIGYKDSTEKEKEMMTKKENNYINLLK